MSASKDPFAKHRFEPFDVPGHLLKAFESSPLLPFPPSQMSAEKGVYALYLHGALVYVGKTSRNNNLRQRLTEHVRKIEGRQNIHPAQMKCRFLITNEDWMVEAAEDYLIHHYKPEWNGTGFGSHVPGAGRPGIRGPVEWDKKFPPKRQH